MQRCHISQWHGRLKRSGKAGMPFRRTFVQDDTTWRTTQLIPCFLVGCWSPMDCPWISSESQCHKTVLHILHDILGYRKLVARWIPHEISEVLQWHSYAVAQALLDRYQREGDDFLRRIVAKDEIWAHSYKPNLKCQSNEWKHPYAMFCENNVHCGIWHWWSNTAPCCTSKAGSKHYLILHVPAVAPSSSAQDTTTILGGTEPHRSSWSLAAASVTKLLRRWQWEIPEHPPYSPIRVHVITISSPKWKNHCGGPRTTQEMNLSVL